MSPLQGVLGLTAATAVAVNALSSEQMLERPSGQDALSTMEAERTTLAAQVAEYEEKLRQLRCQAAESAERLASLESANLSLTQDRAALQRQLDLKSLHCELLANRDTENQAIIGQLWKQLDHAGAERAKLHEQNAEQAKQLAASQQELADLQRAHRAMTEEREAEYEKLRAAYQDHVIQAVAIRDERDAAIEHCEKLMDERDELEGQLLSVSEQSAKLTASEAEARRALGQSNKRIKLLQAQHENGAKERGASVEKIRSLEEQYANLLTKYRSRRAEWKELTALSVGRQRQLSADVDFLVAAYVQLQVQNAGMEAERTQLRSQNTRLLAESTEVRNQNARLLSAGTASPGQNARLELEHSILQDQHARLSTERDELQSQVDKHERTIARLEAKVESQRERLQQPKARPALASASRTGESEGSGATGRHNIEAPSDAKGAIAGRIVKGVLVAGGAVLALAGIHATGGSGPALAAPEEENKKRIEGRAGLPRQLAPPAKR